MKTRSELEAIRRAKERQAKCEQIKASTVAPHGQIVEQQGTGSRILNAEQNEHLRELKIRAAIAAYNHLRSHGVPIHNTRAGEIQVIEQEELLGREIIRKASFEIKFDIPYSNPEGRGIRVASFPVSFQDGKMLMGSQFSYAGNHYPVTKEKLNEISAMREVSKQEAIHTIVAALTDKGHEILGATEMAPAVVTSLKNSGYRVAFRNPQDAINIEVEEPFYEVLLGGGELKEVREIISSYLAPKISKRIAQKDPLEVPASTTPIPSSDQLEEFRTQVNELESKKAQLEEMVTAYAEGLAQKEGYEGMGGLRQRIAELQKQITIAAEELAAPLIQLRDGKVLAKVTAVRLNDPAWKSYLEALSRKARKVVAYLTRWVDLFRTLTVTHAWKEIEPTDIKRTFKKQTEQQEKVKEYLEKQKQLREKAPKYLLEEEGKGINVKSAQAIAAMEAPELMLLEHAVQDIAERADLESQDIREMEMEAKKHQQVDELQEEYPLPEKLAVRSKTAIPFERITFDQPLSEEQKLAVTSYKFSSAGASNHGLFYRAAKKNELVTGKQVLASYIEKGFSEVEAYQQAVKEIQADHKKVQLTLNAGRHLISLGASLEKYSTEDFIDLINSRFGWAIADQAKALLQDNMPFEDQNPNALDAIAKFARIKGEIEVADDLETYLKSLGEERHGESKKVQAKNKNPEKFERCVRDAKRKLKKAKLEVNIKREKAGE